MARSSLRPLYLLGVALGVTLSVAVSACDGSAEPPPPAPPPGRALDPSKPWSRTDLGPRADEAKSASPAGSLTVEPLALADLLRAVPSSGPAPTDPDGGTLLGTDSGVRATASPVTTFGAPHRTKEVSVRSGSFEVTADMASTAIEREARAQLYYPLVTKCRDKNGKILPPDAVLLEFSIDSDGFITPQTISATPSDPAYQQAAECMRVALAALPFRGPAGARNAKPTQVKMTAPSVD